MKLIKLALVACAVMVGLSNQHAIAQDKTDNFKFEPKFYIGAGGGMSSIDTGVTSTTGTAKLDEDDIGFKGLLGVKLNKYIAFEGFYADLGEASLSGNNGDTFVHSGTTYTFTANNVSITTAGTTGGIGFVGMIPVNEMFSPFAKIGAHMWDLEASITSSAGSVNLTEDGTDMFFGVGLQFNINEHIGVRAEWERFKFDDEDVDYISGSLIYTF